MRPSRFSALKRVPGIRPAWRVLWGRYCDVRNVAVRTASAVREGAALALDSTQATLYGSEGPKKPAPRRLVENVWWALRDGRANTLYYAFGMDAEGSHRNDVLSVEDMKRLIRRQVEVDRTHHHASVLRDKYFFSLVAESLGHPSPRTLAILTPSSVDRFGERSSSTYDAWLSAGESIDGFAKQIAGEKGTGAFLLRTEGGRAWIDGQPSTAADIAARVQGRFLLQERVEQHPALNALHPTSLNTIRLVTVLRDGEVIPLVAALRVGVGGMTLDNWSAGGLVAGLDLEEGRLFGRGVFKPGCGSDTRYGGLVDRHPDSGVLLDGYTLPQIPEAVALAQRFHRDMGGPRSIGWDLALTPDGPCVVEGNSHWSGAMYMALSPEFKEQYLDAVCLPGEPRP